MGNGHAILSPSASGMWSTCPASIRMSRDIEREENVYAREGTQFHTLCEVVARHRLLGGSRFEYVDGFLDWINDTNEEWQEDQLHYVEDWITFLQSFLDEDPGATLLLEQRVDTLVPGCWGTADVVIIHTYGLLRVIDIKYGAGVRVSAVNNSQLRLYGAGALNTCVEDALTIQEITNVVWQPRMSNISEETLSRRELLKWRDDLIPTAKLALSEDAPFHPSESACLFCPAAGVCSARSQYMLNQDFGNPEMLSGDEMADAFRRTSELKHWIADIEDAALKRAYEEAGSVPGFKVVRSGGRRQITDNDKAVEVLLNANFPPDKVYTRKVATLGQLDRLTGSAEKLQQVLGDLLVKSEGRLSLAPDSDPRQPADAVHSAQSDFADIEKQGEA